MESAGYCFPLSVLHEPDFITGFDMTVKVDTPCQHFEILDHKIARTRHLPLITGFVETTA